MSSRPDLEIDITAIMTALSVSRHQSVLEVVDDMGRFEHDEALKAFQRAALPALGFDPVLAALRQLPELDTVEDRVFQKLARIVTDAGMLIYAVSCDPLDQTHWAVVGVHCFASEECDLARRNAFVLFDLMGEAAMIPLDIFELALDRSSPDAEVQPFRVYDVLIEGQGDPSA